MLHESQSAGLLLYSLHHVKATQPVIAVSTAPIIALLPHKEPLAGQSPAAASGLAKGGGSNYTNQQVLAAYRTAHTVCKLNTPPPAYAQLLRPPHCPGAVAIMADMYIVAMVAATHQALNSVGVADAGLMTTATSCCHPGGVAIMTGNQQHPGSMHMRNTHQHTWSKQGGWLSLAHARPTFPSSQTAYVHA